MRRENEEEGKQQKTKFVTSTQNFERQSAEELAELRRRVAGINAACRVFEATHSKARFFLSFCFILFCSRRHTKSRS